jgi:hypothetical protein
LEDLRRLQILAYASWAAQKSVPAQYAGGRRPRAESQKPKAKSWKLEAGNWKLNPLDALPGLAVAFAYTGKEVDPADAK